MNTMDKLQQAWQSQCPRFDVNPDQLLQAARLERRVYLGADLFVMVALLGVGAFMFRFILQDFYQNWPWLVYVACMILVVSFMLFNRWRRRRNKARYDNTVLAHVEWSIKDLEHRMRLDHQSFWWYLLPIALGCMIPPVIAFVIDYETRPLADGLVPLLITEAMFVLLFYIVHWVFNFARRIGIKGQQQELQALRTLRENLLTDEKLD